MCTVVTARTERQRVGLVFALKAKDQIVVRRADLHLLADPFGVLLLRGELRQHVGAEYLARLVGHTDIRPSHIDAGVAVGPLGDG